jgi:tripartite-type tricarboxylate transporter receptor subunit TctC
MELPLAAFGPAGAAHVPYDGNPAVVTAPIAGQVQAALMPPGVRAPSLEVWVALVAAAFADAGLRERLHAAGWEPQGSRGDALAARVRDEARVFGELIAARGIRLE